MTQLTITANQSTWTKVKLGTLVNRLTNGYVGPTRNLYQDAGIPYLLARHVKSNRLTFDGKTFVTEEFNQKNKKSILKTGDVLLVQSGHIGQSAVVPPEHEGHNCHAMIVISPKEDQVDGKFLSWYFASPAGQAAFRRIQTGITIEHLNCRDVKEVEVPLPPIAEQRRIAAILDRADAVRRKRQEAIALTEELLQSAFLEMFGDPIINSKGWEIVPFSHLVKGEMRNGLSPSTKGTYKGQVLTLSAVTQGAFKGTEKKTAEFDVCPPKDKMVQKSDLLVCRGNGNLNLVGCARFPDVDYDDVMFPDTMIGVPINFSIIHAAYLESLWNSSAVRRQIEQHARTTNGTHKINQRVLNDIQILLPPLTLQEKFAEVCNAVKAVHTRCVVSTPSDLFNSLLQRAFRGEL